MCFENIYACKEKLYTIILLKYIILNGYTPENPLLLKNWVCFAKNDCYVSYLQGSGIIVMTFVGNPTLLSTIIYDNDVKFFCPVIALSKNHEF